MCLTPSPLVNSYDSHVRQRHIAMHPCRVLVVVCSCPHKGENDFKKALKLERSGSERAHVQMTNVQCFKTGCTYHMGEITGTGLYIYRN